MAPSSSSSFSTNFKGKYDVFLSFRGEDTRDSFTSHLYAALSGKKILTFMDNTNLTKGEEISKSISKAIEESTLSVIVFSKKYAFSKWCLDEVVKILECKKRNGQMVIPVFYRVDPVHVRNQTGSFEAAFAKHEELLKDKMDKVESWRAALKEAANISGWDSVVTRPDSKLIEEIVGDILKKLYKISPSNSIGLVGIDSRIKQIESLLCMDSSNVLMLGIWGMGGIGKTTLARAIFDRISIQYESCCFLVNVREQLKRCLLVHLQDELLSKILEENIDSRSPCLGVNFLKDRLRRKKVLVVLDDIDNARQLQELLPGLHDLFGPGSRILVTSRDKQVLKSVVDEIYKVEELNHQEALQLFCLNAFKKNCPEIDYVERSRRVVNYAKGNPLALRVLGSTLLGRSEEDWDSALEKLENVRNCEIQNVLRISYDGLDGKEKRMFLDIACFFRGEDRSYVTKILSGCYSSVHYTISTFIDKSLVSVSHNKLQMHDLLQEMGWSIVRNEPELGKRSRLWNSKDVYCVLTKKKGTRAIEGISLDLSTAREMHLESDAFAGMDHLRILKFYMSNSSIGCNDKVHLPRRGLQSLSDELRYLHWHKFPSKSLPSKFSAENLVVLDLPHSNVEQLWTGAQLDECKKLVSLPSSIHKVSQLRSIYLSYCKSLRALPELPLSLKVLEANGCRAMETFSSNRKSNFMNLSFTNCFKLDQKERSEIIENTHSTVQFLTSKFREYRDQVRILFQGNEIPECFHEQTMGTSLSIQLPPNWHQFQGIAFCIVFASEDPSIVCRISRFKCECHFRSNNKENEDIICNWVCFVDDLHLHEPDQVLLWYDPGIKALQGNGSAKEEDWFNKYSSASFQFYPQRWKKFQKHCKVKKCGVLLL
ncbi:disease resistance-like protein DSC1 [Hevea brasiliensis]|uniref:disease resistance-like protein DSC1 n=1 Tax=Hevea brasiliensis TaxID=3981 RepID=UPI0025CFA5E6|nr:disease resistance-like protein DSC1 [Hevea brasiliensis]